MAFAIAHGDADACGAGCNEWIAANGVFDQDVEKRFRNFLDSLHGRKLPIFFNSSGGFIRKAIAKSRRLTAAIEERNRAERRQYIKQMVLDPELVEFGDRTPYINMHMLTPNEISRYQIETVRR